MKVVITGGGVAGFSAAMTARKAGAEVTLIERTDLLGGLGMVAGIGLLGFWHTAVFQEKALGGADLIDVFEAIMTHKGINAPGYTDTLLYNVTKLYATLQKFLMAAGIEVLIARKVADIDMSGKTVTSVLLSDGSVLPGDVFVDTTGNARGWQACDEHGFGCVDCIYRCPAFGNPCGLVDKNPDAKMFDRIGSDGKPGTIGTSVMVPIASLSDEYQETLAKEGFISIPVPKDVEPDWVRFGRAGASTTALMDQDITKMNILLLDIGGFVKVTATGSPLFARSLRKFPGMEDSQIMQPVAGARGHLVHGLGMAVRDNTMKVEGFDNLFVGGTKSGPAMSLMDAMVTGDLAGCNAARLGFGKEPVVLPLNLAAGAYIDHVGKARENVKRGFQGIVQMELLKGLNVYREGSAIAAEVDKAGLTGLYRTKLN